MKKNGKQKLEKFLARLAANLQDRRSTTVLGLLKAKGLLLIDYIKPLPSVKVNIKDAIWVGVNVEPRVLEVLPAAILHSPACFYGLELAPKELREVLACLKAGKTEGPDLDWVKYSELKRWADLKPKDGRAKPLSEKRFARTYRLKPSTISAISSMAKSQNLSEGKLIDRLVQSKQE